jgi:hypothetical protein
MLWSMSWGNTTTKWATNGESDSPNVLPKNDKTEGFPKAPTKTLQLQLSVHYHAMPIQVARLGRHNNYALSILAPNQNAAPFAAPYVKSSGITSSTPRILPFPPSPQS